uniref:Uncharacterized protein n=1 Tax=Callorhinchus milii TaxID=7868 RepID=A0A4W3IIX7_CALMI
MAAAAAAAVVRGTGSTPTRTGGFLGTTSPAPMADLYGTANQDSGVSSYISAASPAPSTGFGHSLGVSGQPRGQGHQGQPHPPPPHPQPPHPNHTVWVRGGVCVCGGVGVGEVCVCLCVRGWGSDGV